MTVVCDVSPLLLKSHQVSYYYNTPLNFLQFLYTPLPIHSFKMPGKRFATKVCPMLPQLDLC